MSLQDYGKTIRERWIALVSIFFLCIVASVVVFFLRPPEYTASTALYVSAQVGDNPQQAYQGAQLSEQRVKSYTELVSGERVLREVIQRLNLPVTESELGARVSATSGLDSVIINLSVTDESASQAAAIANATARATIEVVDDLERPMTPDGIAPVAVRVVQEANPPTEPSSAGLSSTLIVGGLVGLVSGLAVALLRGFLDSSVKSLPQLNDITAAPNLGTVAFSSQLTAAPLIVKDKPQSPISESFRQIRTNLQFVDVDETRKVLILTSSLPAEGKTTTVANLALALGSAGVRILVIEADLRRPRLAGLLGLESSVGLTSVLSGRVKLSGAIQSWQGGVLDVLASGPLPPNPSELLGSNQMGILIGEARQRYDYVLVDTPPLLPVTDAAVLGRLSDGAVLVCGHKRATEQQLIQATSALKSTACRVLGTVLTMIPNAESRSYAYDSYYSSAKVARAGFHGPSESLDSRPVGGAVFSANEGAIVEETRPVPKRRPS